MHGEKVKNRKVVYLRPKKRSFKLTFIIALIFCLAAFFLLLSFFRRTTYIVQEGDLCESFTSNAVVIRQEEVIKAPVDGHLEILVKPKERVRVKTPLFKVISDRKKQEEYIKQINEVKNKLEGIKSEHDQQKQSVLDKSIKDMTVKLQETVAKGDLENANNIKSELERLKAEKDRKRKIREENIKTMQESLENLRDKAKDVEHTVYAPISGIVSFNIDGNEELLSPGCIHNITHNDIKSIYNEAKENKESLLSVSSDIPVLKIIDNYYYYIAVPMDLKLQQGQSYDLVFASRDEPVKGKLVHVTGNSKYIGVFRLNSDVDELLTARNLKVTVLADRFYGKMVPRDCLEIIEGKEGVYTIQRNKRVFKPVKVIAKDENYAIVEGLKIGDKILLK